ncbi:MAG: hypothetical protein ACM3X6_14070 [Patescibacteria group bacterium]
MADGTVCPWPRADNRAGICQARAFMELPTLRLSRLRNVLVETFSRMQ